MYNQTLISAALIKCGNPDEAQRKRGAVELFRRFVPAYFADDLTAGWPTSSDRQCRPFYIQSTPHEALPIDMPVDTGQVNGATFDFGTFQFHVIKPESPMDNPDSGQLAAQYERGGAIIRDFVALDMVHSSTIMNIIMRMLKVTPGSYESDYKELLNKMTQIGDEYSKMFP